MTFDEEKADDSERIEIAAAVLDHAPVLGKKALESVLEKAREQSVDDLGIAREIAEIYTTETSFAEAVSGMDFDGPDLSDPARRLAFSLNVAGIEARRARISSDGHAFPEPSGVTPPLPVALRWNI